MSRRPHRLLTLDLATHLGWAYGSAHEGDPVSGAHRLPVTGEDIGAFAVAYDRWLHAMVREAEPTFCVFEAPMATTAGRSTLATTQKLQGLCWHTEFVCRTYGIEYRQVAAASWKKMFTGSGSASKAKARATGGVYPVISACRERGWDVTNDNQADALGIFVYACAIIDQSRVSRFDPLARYGQEALL